MLISHPSVWTGAGLAVLKGLQQAVILCSNIRHHTDLLGNRFVCLPSTPGVCVYPT